MEKIKKSMRREDGFTLVELLAVIVILGIILAIAIPAIGGVINRAQEDADAAEQDLVVDAGRLYFTTGENIKANWVTVKQLVEGDYLEIRDVGGQFASVSEAGAITYKHTDGGGVAKEKSDGSSTTYKYYTAKPAGLPEIEG